MSQATLKENEVGSDLDKQSRHPLFYLFGILGFCTFVALGYFYQLVNDPEKFPIRKISVDGEFVNLKPADVEILVSKAVIGGFFSLDVDRLRERILNNPWIASVSVRRIWPDSIRVSIREQDAIAFWGDHALLNDKADIFAPEVLPAGVSMVRLDGPIGTEAAVLEKYSVLKDVFDVIGIKLKSVEMNDRRAWKVKTDQDVVIHLGRDDLFAKMKRFHAAYNSSLGRDWPQIAEVDLRYTNGLTVKKIPEIEISDSNTQS